jgi:hypothetical protein
MLNDKINEQMRRLVNKSREVERLLAMAHNKMTD